MSTVQTNQLKMQADYAQDSATKARAILAKAEADGADSETRRIIRYGCLYLEDIADKAHDKWAKAFRADTRNRVWQSEPV